MLTKAARSRRRTPAEAPRTAPARGGRRARFLACLTGSVLLFVGAVFGPGEPPAAAQEGPPEVNFKKVKKAAAPAPAPKKAQPAGPAEGGPPELTFKVTKKAGGQGWSGSLTAEQQKAVNAAIDRGVAYLRETQMRNGSWASKEHQQYSIGYAALAGLTLLECGVPADDPAVKKAALHVRFSAANLTMTYQISLAILFLDRLGNSRDRKLIQTLGLRLVAGQNSAGGWSYHCPVLKTQEEMLLLAYLRQHQPKHLQEGIAWAKPGSLLHEGIVDPKVKLKMAALAQGVADDAKQAETAPPPETTLADPLPPGVKPKAKGTPKAKVAKKAPAPPPQMPKIHRAFLPPRVRDLPVVGPVGAKGKIEQGGGGDNSNTQFAILGLWAARRHWVPMERTLALMEDRFRSSQNPQGGGWNYHLGGGQSVTMTCVGLIGLAIGQGSAREAALDPGAMPGKPAAQDEAISKGLRALGNYIQPGARQAPAGLYFMWSLERVGVLYGLKTIGNKDWYRWGVEILLPNQRPDGGWAMGGYHGAAPALDTSMALLFLKRANLTEDLTRTIRLQMAITDPDAGPGVGAKK